MRNFTSVTPDKQVQLLVNNIWILKNQQNTGITTLPFFADGFPGLVFHDSTGKLLVLPQNKVMPSIFLYGQTIHPVEMKVKGRFRLIVFQFYPFVLKRIFGLNPKELEDACHDLTDWLPELKKTSSTRRVSSIPDEDIIHFISTKLLERFNQYKDRFNNQILEAVNLILEGKGKVTNQSIAEKVGSSKRTLERNFLKETGLTPKQFSLILQFNSSLAQIEARTYKKLSDVVYLNGYADQSHFIKVFKSYTGKTPKQFKK